MDMPGEFTNSSALTAALLEPLLGHATDALVAFTLAAMRLGGLLLVAPTFGHRAVWG